jgi:uncharacterized membrane protein YraQ (UPF0718 family)
MHFLSNYLHEVWTLTAQLAPWLLLGFALAGLISLFVRRALVTRILGKPGLGSIVKATLIGVPMPLCSCGVIPVAAAIREKGAGRGATASFLASTPETGVDSFVATWGMLGPVMACVRVVVAFFTGIFSGVLVQFVTRHDKDEFAGAGEEKCSCSEPRAKVMDALKYAFITMPKDMAPSLVFGILAAAAISALVPGDFFASFGATGIWAYLVITLIAVPLYVCSTGSIPLALAMINSGFSPGCALVFLISGPATNVATIVTMRRYLGTKAIAAYLFAIIAVAWTAGAVVDAGFGRETIMGQMPHDMSSVSIFGAISAVILLALVLRGLFARLLDRCRASGASCCAASSEHCSCHTSAANDAASDCCCHKSSEASSEDCHCHDSDSGATGESSGEEDCHCHEEKGGCHCHEDKNNPDTRDHHDGNGADSGGKCPHCGK